MAFTVPTCAAGEITLLAFAAGEIAKTDAEAIAARVNWLNLFCFGMTASNVGISDLMDASTALVRID
jgi:hypothetical protein